MKNYVIDTNVLIQAPNALWAFQENRIVIPLVVVEELDHLKKAEGEELNFLEFAQKVQKKVIDTGLREKICGDCEWNEICSEKSSRWENKNILR